MVNSGGSRIFPRGGANSQKCYYFSIFCRKLHENERIWTPGGGGARPWRPPLDPPMVKIILAKIQNERTVGGSTVHRMFFNFIGVFFFSEIKKNTYGKGA